MDVDWGRRAYTSEELICAWNSSESVAEVQRKLGLKVGNPVSVRNAASKLGLTKVPGKSRPTKVWKCVCGEEFNSRSSMYNHKRDLGATHHYDYLDKSLSKCRYCSKKSNTTTGVSNHEKYCKRNPNRIVMVGTSHTPETKRMLSDLMSERHRANIANRWKNPHLYESYPEKFFARVIRREFTDKKVTREYPVGKYFIDFAWVDKKLAIEIDGEQHYRYRHQMESDALKDALLESQGWKVLRIRFKDMYADPKRYIALAYNFIHK